MGATTAVMVVVGRAIIATAMLFCRCGCTVLIDLAARFGEVGANIGTTPIGTEDAGIQPGQRAKNHQPCEHQSRQDGRRLDGVS